MQRLAIAAIVTVTWAVAALAAGSSSFFTQNGAGNVADVDQSAATQGQVGTPSNPFLQQNGNGHGGNQVTIIQGGTREFVGGVTTGLAPTVPAVGQSGTANQATVRQSGTDDSVTLSQVGDHNGHFPGAVHAIEQGADANANSIVLSQLGVENDFSLFQDGGARNSASVLQSGRRNFAWSHQNGERLAANMAQFNAFNVTSSYQAGAAHRLSVTQDNGPAGVGSSVSNAQLGFENSASVLSQKTTGGGTNQVFNLQTGSNNIVTVTAQTSNATGTNEITNKQSMASNVSAAMQTGALLHIDNRQEGFGGLAIFNQSGTDSRARLVQTAGSGPGNIAEIQQFGHGNTLAATQSAHGNGVSASQTGSFLTANFVQSGASNRIEASQAGFRHAAFVTQGSNGNVADFRQTGEIHLLTIRQ